MTQELTHPYPTVQDKKALFERHGIRVHDAYEVDASEHYFDGALMQVISLASEQVCPDTAIAIAKSAGIRVRALRTTSALTEDGDIDKFFVHHDLIFSDFDVTQFRRF